MRGRRSTIRYWPVPSVTAERTFSISAGLEASTVTPGSTAPDVSRTRPVIEAWAMAIAGSKHSHTAATRREIHSRMQLSSEDEKTTGEHPFGVEGPQYQ